jgi:hypothetical protein
MPFVFSRTHRLCRRSRRCHMHSPPIKCMMSMQHDSAGHRSTTISDRTLLQIAMIMLMLVLALARWRRRRRRYITFRIRHRRRKSHNNNNNNNNNLLNNLLNNHNYNNNDNNNMWMRTRSHGATSSCCSIATLRCRTLVRRRRWRSLWLLLLPPVYLWYEQRREGERERERERNYDSPTMNRRRPAKPARHCRCSSALRAPAHCSRC